MSKNLRVFYAFLLMLNTFLAVQANTGNISKSLSVPNCQAWSDQISYPQGSIVTYLGYAYTATMDIAANPGANWNPTADHRWAAGGDCGITPPPPPANCQPWSDQISYPQGATVTYLGNSYIATMNIAANPGANWNPISDRRWAAGGNCTSPPPVVPPAPGACQQWSDQVSYAAGTVVVYAGNNYTARVDIAAYPGANWNPTVDNRWVAGGTCTPPVVATINISVPALPAALAGYTGTPTLTLTGSDASDVVTQSVSWNGTAAFTTLNNAVTYTFSTPNIQYAGNVCTATFTPPSLLTNSQTPGSAQLSYACTPVAVDSIAISVSGVPASVSSIALTFTPSDNSGVVNASINISNGQGSGNVSLNDGVSYTVAAASVSGYAAMITPQPVVAANGGSVSVVYQQQVTPMARNIGYLPGWITPPAASDLANAGYTHILVAFGVFSTTTPGQIVSAFSTITADYIASLQSVGIKVLLSLGGASSSVDNTTVDFHSVLSMTTPTQFQETFVQSVQSFVTEYGFDGVDIDVEQGLNGGGTFSQPAGDIAVLASIINELYATIPNFLISLVPQSANISATSGYDETWGNYAALVMQTYESLAWVGIQLYNTGCCYGIDQVCYDPSAVSSPNFAVAMATDLLENWPATDPEGRATGFQPYISYLKPTQVVIGFPSPASNGAGDGGPITPISTIKNAIQCLRTGTECGTFVPPRTYPGFGGVFNWQVDNDEDNGYAFAKGLSACLSQGNCN